MARYHRVESVAWHDFVIKGIERRINRTSMAFLPQRKTTVVVQQRERPCCSPGPSSITSTFRSLSSIVDSVLLRVA